MGYNGPFDNFNIEHCIPDAESEMNAHIGNLMLLEEHTNHDLCQGKPLSQKIQYYRDSALKLPVKMVEDNPAGAAIDFDERSTWIAELLHSYITKVRVAEPAIPG